MPRPNIYTILPVMATLRPADLTRIADYLSLSGSGQFLNLMDKEALFKERGLSSTPMNKVYQSFVDDRVYNFFSLINFNTGVNIHLPEGLTHRHVTLDMRQVVQIDPSASRRIAASLNLNNQIVSNVTQVVKTDGRYYYLKDQERFQSNIVRDALSGSYFNSRNKSSWLRSSILATFSKVYGLLLGNSIARWYGLDIGQQDFATITFALFFLCQCCDPRDATGILLSRYRDYYLKDRNVVMLVLSRINEVLGKEAPETLDECFTLLNGLSIARMQVSRPVLYSKLRTIGDDLPTTAIALEYAPYFVWAILNAMSGSKNQLNIFIKRQNLMKDLVKAVGELLQSTPSLS